MVLKGHTEVLGSKPWLFPLKSAGLLRWGPGMAGLSSSTNLQGHLQPWGSLRKSWRCAAGQEGGCGVMSCPTPQPGKGAASNAGPSSTYAPSPEQLATILGSLICCDLSSQNICLKKDQIFIAHLCILLKGEMRLVRVDKCQSMCEESKCEEKKRREKKGEKEHFFNL